MVDPAWTLSCRQPHDDQTQANINIHIGGAGSENFEGLTFPHRLPSPRPFLLLSSFTILACQTAKNALCSCFTRHLEVMIVTGRRHSLLFQSQS